MRKCPEGVGEPGVRGVPKPHVKGVVPAGGGGSGVHLRSSTCLVSGQASDAAGTRRKAKQGAIGSLPASPQGCYSPVTAAPNISGSTFHGVAPRTLLDFHKSSAHHFLGFRTPRAVK